MHTTFSTLTDARRAQLTADANQQRNQQKLAALTLNDQLSNTATERARAVANGAKEKETDALQRLVKSGVFARFALSTVVKTSSAEAAYHELFSNPLHAGKLQHNGISHIGFGMATGNGKTFLVVDMARLVESVDEKKLAAALLSRINHNRSRIKAPPLKDEANLMAAANRMNTEFMTSGTGEDMLVDSIRTELSGKQMTLGKITISFQTASVSADLSLPERTSDPSARYIGMAVHQGNVPNQDPGALVMTIILAAPPADADTTSQASHLPPPRAMPDGHKPDTKASVEEQAWLATLVGNHKKAAALFLKAFKRAKEPRFMYEAARAHARNGENVAALDKMKRYAGLCESSCSDAEKQTAKDMIKKLEKGESIFSTSKQAKYNVEAKRFFILGQKLFSDGQWEGALDAFSQAYTYAPHPDLIYNMGLAHLKAGHVGDALDFFQEYQRQVPEAQSADQAQQLFSMGVELYNVGQYDAAAKRFTMAYSFLPLEEILYNLALCHMALEEKKEALRIFQELADKTADDDKKAEYRKMIEELQK